MYRANDDRNVIEYFVANHIIFTRCTFNGHIVMVLCIRKRISVVHLECFWGCSYVCASVCMQFFVFFFSGSCVCVLFFSLASVACFVCGKTENGDLVTAIFHRSTHAYVCAVVEERMHLHGVKNYTQQTIRIM